MLPSHHTWCAYSRFPRSKTTAPACSPAKMSQHVATLTLTLISTFEPWSNMHFRAPHRRHHHGHHAADTKWEGHGTSEVGQVKCKSRCCWELQTTITCSALTNGACLAMFSTWFRSESGSEVFQTPCPTAMYVHHHSHDAQDGQMINFEHCPKVAII